MPKLKRAKSIAEIYATKHDLLEFDGDWEQHIGCPEVRGSWIIYGHSGNGKTSYSLQLAKMLTNFGPVWYNGLEEYDAASFKKALRMVGMEASAKKFKLMEDRYLELRARLRKRNRPRFVIIDSLQLFLRSFDEFLQLEKEFGNIQFIYISHAEGKKPEGRIGKRVEYLSYVKIRVEGFKAFVKSRYGGTEPFVIYPKRAAEYWGDIK